MRFLPIRRSLQLVRPTGLISVATAVMILVAGYGSGVEVLYRPLADGPSTHPLTAVSIALLGGALVVWRPRRFGRMALAMAATALLLAIARLFEIAISGNFLDAITPFRGTVLDNRKAGTPIATGANTAAMVVLLACSIFASRYRRYRLAQVLTFVGIGLPLVSVTGYAYGIEKFYGRMALTTAIAGLPAGVGILLAGAHRGMLHSVLSPWIGGRIARVQLVLGYVVPFMIGNALLALTVDNPAELFGLLIVLVSAFIAGLVVISAVVQEQIDRRRRGAERRLALAATRDPLTNLPNRRLLFEHGTRELERALRNGTRLSALMLDIDHFKQLNDRHGHGTGDAALRRIADVMREEVRHQDLPARYGGEEFAILLPDTPIDGAQQLAEKLRRRIAAEHFPTEHNAVAVTLSVGCAESDGSTDLAQLLNQADAALYLAKALGRNRVELADAAGQAHACHRIGELAHDQQPMA